MAAAPNIPITDLTKTNMMIDATTGGNDSLTFGYGTEAWGVTAKDSVLDLGSVWHQAEFNVVGDGRGSQATFNYGSSLSLQLMIADGSNAAPSCTPGIATTGTPTI